MSHTPTSQEERLAQKLGLTPTEQTAFLSALHEGKSGRTALVITPSAPPGYNIPFAYEDIHPSWGDGNIRILSTTPGNEGKPGSHDDYRNGYYYPLDLSSVWETAPLAQIPQPMRCLDLCAAPGGKTILAQTRVTPFEHISNEVHAKRLGMMRSNLSRTGFGNLYTQRLRPDQWAELAPLSFDLLLVDAPCSGQSLLAKGIVNPGCFHPSTMKGNAKRQRSILHCAIKTLAPGGLLLYTTCTFAPDENEKTIAYILKRYEDMEAVSVETLSVFRSPIADFPCYRLLPTAGFGSGGFSCLLRKKGTQEPLPELEKDILAWPVASHGSIKP